MFSNPVYILIFLCLMASYRLALLCSDIHDFGNYGSRTKSPGHKPHTKNQDKGLGGFGFCPVPRNYYYYFIFIILTWHFLFFQGTGKISSKGGDSNCVAHCSSCNKKYRCLECESGYFLVSDNCVSSCVLQANQCCYQGGTSLQCNVVDTSNCYRGYCKNETSSKPLVCTMTSLHQKPPALCPSLVKIA